MRKQMRFNIYLTVVVTAVYSGAAILIAQWLERWLSPFLFHVH